MNTDIDLLRFHKSPELERIPADHLLLGLDRGSGEPFANAAFQTLDATLCASYDGVSMLAHGKVGSNQHHDNVMTLNREDPERTCARLALISEKVIERTGAVLNRTPSTAGVCPPENRALRLAQTNASDGPMGTVPALFFRHPPVQRVHASDRTCLPKKITDRAFANEPDRIELSFVNADLEQLISPDLVKFVESIFDAGLEGASLPLTPGLITAVFSTTSAER
jgi:hypothetical protein